MQNMSVQLRYSGLLKINWTNILMTSLSSWQCEVSHPEYYADRPLREYLWIYPSNLFEIILKKNEMYLDYALHYKSNPKAMQSLFNVHSKLYMALQTDFLAATLTRKTSLMTTIVILNWTSLHTLSWLISTWVSNLITFNKSGTSNRLP